MDIAENKVNKENDKITQSEDKQNGLKSKIFLKFLVKLKRGAFWSERILVLTEKKLMYFKKDGEKRFDEDISSCKISSEQFSNEIKKHTIIISSTNSKFDDIKLINDESNMSSTNGVVSLIKPGLSDFIKEFNTLKNNSNNKEEKIRNTEKFSTQKINRDEISKKLEFSESKIETTDNESNFDLTNSKKDDNIINSKSEILTPINHISSSALINSKNNETDIIDSNNLVLLEKNQSNSKVNTQTASTHIHHMKMDKVIYNSSEIPLTEILKTFICEPEICCDAFFGSKITSNFNLDLLRKIPKPYELSYLTEISNIEEQINDVSLNENKNHKSSLILIISILSYNLISSLNFNNNDFNLYTFVTENLLNISILLFALIVFLFFSKSNELEVRSVGEMCKEYKEKSLHFSTDSTLKVSYYFQHSFNTLVDFFKSYQNTKEYMKNIENIDDSKKEEGLIYVMNNGTKDKVVRFKVKRIAIKRNSLFIIAEYVNNDLLKMIVVEKVSRNEETETNQEINFSKVSVFIPVNVTLKHKIPETFIHNSIESLHLVDQLFLRNNMNSIPQDLNQLLILNKQLS